MIGLVLAEIEASGGRVDYVDLVDALSLLPLSVVERPATMAVAALFGGTRLIDNLAIARGPTDPL